MQQRLDAAASMLSVKLITGIFFTIVGLLMTVDNLNLFDGGRYLRYWPVVLIAIGLAKFNEARTFGAILTVSGIGLLALNTNFVHLSLFDLWPLLLIVAGALIVTQAFAVRAEHSDRWYALLSQRNATIDAKDFGGGKIVAVLGGCQLNLAGADVGKGPAVIDLFVLMGGVELRIPEGWEVFGNVMPFMGGIDIRARSKQGGKRLVLRGFVMMGGVEVKS